MTHKSKVTPATPPLFCSQVAKYPVMDIISLVPWAQCPLVSMTYFTKWLHFLLSIASPCRVQISLLHQSTMSSVHLLLGLPLLFLSSIMPKTACFRSLMSCILNMCPKKFNFLPIILWTILMLLSVLVTDS